MTSCRTRSGVTAALMAVAALTLGGLTSPATGATSKATVRGVVTLDGKPVPFARVQLFRDIGHDVEHPDFVRYKTASTDSKGRYSLSGLTLKKLPKESRGYRVVVSDRPGNIVKTVRLVTPRKGKTVTRNVGTRRAATLTGTVTRADGGDPRVLTVFIGTYDGFSDDNTPAFNPQDTTTVRADGTFTLSGINPDEYGSVRVSGRPYASQCYDFVTRTLAECNPPAVRSIVLGAGERLALPPVVASKLLPPVTTVKGKVTDTSGKALKGVRVSLGGTPTFTRSSGRYTVADDLAAGPTQVRFYDPIWVETGGPDAPSAPPSIISVTPGQSFAGVDTRLKSRSTMKFSARTTGRTARVAVQIKRKSTSSAPSGTLTLSLGANSSTVPVAKGRATATLTNLPKGHHYLRASYSGTGSTAGVVKDVAIYIK